MSRVDAKQLLAEDSELFLAAIECTKSEAFQQERLVPRNPVYWFSHATERRYEQIVSILLDAGPNAQLTDAEDRKRALQNACGFWLLGIVQLLIDHDGALLDATLNGWTPLSFASFFRCPEICRFLVDRGCNIHAIVTSQLVEHGNALMIAIRRGNFYTMRMLLSAGANVDDCDMDGRAALHYAAEDFSPDQMRELFRHNADMCCMDRGGETPFDIAKASGNVKVLDLLIQMYSHRLSQNNLHHLALHELLRSAKYSFADFQVGYWFHPVLHPLRVKIQLGLLDWKHLRTLFLSVDAALFRIRDDLGRLPIHVACQTNAPVEVLTALVELDPATLHMADFAGDLPLHVWCRYYSDTTDYFSTLRYLVEIGGGIGTLAARNRDGALPLHVLCGASTITTASLALPVVQYLIQSFPESVAMSTNTGMYPFMIAAKHAPLSVVYEIVRANPVFAIPR